MADTKTSDETAAGTLDGSELIRIVQGGAMRRATAQEIADLGGGGGGGLYSGSISSVPTSAGTGLSTWLNQGTATIADRANGITLANASLGGTDSAACRRKAPALSPPYTVSALLGLTASTIGATQNGLSAGIGWTDLTKLHVVNIAYSNGWLPVVQKWTTATAVGANDFVGVVNVIPEPMIWFHIVDDVTNVKFGYSRSGDPEDAHVLFSVAQASGHLGAAGYSNLLFYGNARQADIRVALMAWLEESGAAF